MILKLSILWTMLAASPVASADSLYESVRLANPDFVPGIASSTYQTYQIFGALDRPYGVEDCFVRARDWAKKIQELSQLRPMKAFLFFTHRFKVNYHRIQKKEFIWWFHVAPYVFMSSGEPTNPSIQVFDPEFTHRPLELAEWVEVFLSTENAKTPHRPCVNLTQPHEFNAIKKEVQRGRNAVFGIEDCYLFHAPGDFFEPGDFET